MPGESESVAVEETPQAFGDVEAPIDATSPVPEGDQETPPQEETYDTWLERLQANEALKTAHEARLEELHQEALKKGRSDTHSRLQPLVQQGRDHATQAMASSLRVEAAIMQAIEEGTLDEKVVKRAWQEQQAWLGREALAEGQGSVRGAKTFIAFAAGEHKDLAEKYIAQVDAIFQGVTTAQAVAEDFVSDLVDARVEKAKAPLQAKIKALEAQLEKGKAQVRTGQGPNTTTGAATGGKMSVREAEAAYADGRIGEAQARSFGVKF